MSQNFAHTGNLPLDCSLLEFAPDLRPALFPQNSMKFILIRRNTAIRQLYTPSKYSCQLTNSDIFHLFFPNILTQRSRRTQRKKMRNNEEFLPLTTLTNTNNSSVIELRFVRFVMVRGKKLDMIF